MNVAPVAASAIASPAPLEQPADPLLASVAAGDAQQTQLLTALTGANQGWLGTILNILA
jgi:hypothetical protein